MLSMQNSSFYHGFHGALQDEGCSGSPNIPTLPRIDAPRASVSSASTGASPDDTSTDSPGWDGSDRSPPVDLDASNPFHPSASDDFAIDPHTKFADMDATAKVEELDEDDLQSIKPSEAGNEHEDNIAGAPAAVPRKRGRPRKHPLPAPGGQLKVTKGRSKTGCITCRRRKKKCDETKPA